MVIKRIDHKHLLGNRWMDYQVLKEEEFDTIDLYPENVLEGKIYIGKQDGFWVSGQDIFGHGYFPGRKWGVFESRADAILYVIQENLPVANRLLKNNEAWRKCLSMAEVRKMKNRLIELKNEIIQPKLF